MGTTEFLGSFLSSYKGSTDIIIIAAVLFHVIAFGTIFYCHITSNNKSMPDFKGKIGKD